MSTDLVKPVTSAPWYLVLLQGILSLLIGLLLFATPGTAMVVLVRLLGWYWLIKGIFSLTAIFHPGAQTHRGWLIFNSVLGIFAGLAVLDHPLMSAVFVPSMLVTFVGVLGIFIGVNDLAAAFRGAGAGVGLLGVVSIVLGVALLGNTLIGVAALPYLIGAAAVLGGLSAVILAGKLRTAQKA